MIKPLYWSQWISSTASVSKTGRDMCARDSIFGTTKVSTAASFVSCCCAPCDITVELFLIKTVRLFQLSNFIFQFTQSVTGGVFLRILSTLSTAVLGMLWLCPCTSSAPIRTGLFALSPITPLLPLAVNSYKKEREKSPCFFSKYWEISHKICCSKCEKNGGN